MRFVPRCSSRLPNLTAFMDGPFTLGNEPCYVDFLLYACLHDLKAFVPKCFEGNGNPKIAFFLKRFESLPELKSWFADVDTKEYIRPSYPNIHFLLPQ